MYKSEDIRAAMGAQKLSQAKVAEIAKLNINTVSAVCNGKEKIELPTLKKVADAVGLVMEIRLTPKSEPVQG
jgi:transcriptional regulator with XRE-family HTH domain